MISLSTAHTDPRMALAARRHIKALKRTLADRSDVYAAADYSRAVCLFWDAYHKCRAEDEAMAKERDAA